MPKHWLPCTVERLETPTSVIFLSSLITRFIEGPVYTRTPVRCIYTTVHVYQPGAPFHSATGKRGLSCARHCKSSAHASALSRSGSGVIAHHKRRSAYSDEKQKARSSREGGEECGQQVGALKSAAGRGLWGCGPVLPRAMPHRPGAGVRPTRGH